MIILQILKKNHLQITAIDNPPWTLSLEEAIQWFHSAIVYA
jgi:hypothetical protein